MKKLLSKISVAAFIAAISLICGCSNPGTSSSTPDSTPSACEHTGGTATCTEKAICETCGEAYGEALGHEAAAEWTITTEATCVAKGEQVKTCTREGCGEVVETEEIAINPDNHTAAEEWTITTEATCVAKGEKVKTCTNEGCDEVVETEEIAALDHAPAADWTVKTPATCTEAGVQVKICTREGCGAEAVSEPIAALDHEIPTEWTVKTEATCVAEGEEVKNCTREGCGAQVASQPIAINPNNHAGEWETIYEASCTGAGEKQFDCTREGCEYTATEYPAALPHNYDKTTLKCENFEECYYQYEKQVPVVDKAYIFGMTQGKVNNEVYYLKGGMNGFYMATTDNPNEALKVYLEATEGGYYAYCYVDEVKTYINMVVNGTHVNGAYEATASTVYTIDEEHHTLIGVVNDTDYWFSTRNDNTYTTVGPNKTSYNGFYCEFYGIHEHAFTIEGDIIIEATSCKDTKIVDTGKGQKEMHCSCGAVAPIDYYLEHIDENLDCKCDRTHQKVDADGNPMVDDKGEPVMKNCGGRVYPPAGSIITIKQANDSLGLPLKDIYVEGVVTKVLDALNGCFIITDATDSIYVRLPKNAAGQSYSAWTDVKVVLGDTVKVYGGPKANSGVTGDAAVSRQKFEGALLTITAHEHSYSEPTCSKPATCGCLATQGETLPHTNENNDYFCDVCSTIVVEMSSSTMTTYNNDNSSVISGTTRTWANDVFSVVISGTIDSTTSNDYAKLKNGSTVTISTKEGQTIKQIIIDGSTTSISYLEKIEKDLTTAGYTVVKNAEAKTLTISFTEPVTSIQFKSTSTGRFSGMTIYY